MPPGNPFAYDLGRGLGELPGRIIDNSERAAQERERLAQQDRAALRSAFFGGATGVRDFVSGIGEGLTTVPSEMPNPTRDPRGAMTWMGQQPSPMDPTKRLMQEALKPRPAAPGTLEWFKEQQGTANTPDPNDGMEALMRSAGLRLPPTPTPALPTPSPAARVPLATPQMRVQRDASGRIIGASNQPGAQGEVFDGSNSAVSFPGGQDDAAYQNYRRNLLGDVAFEGERASIARDRMLADDPFAEQNSALMRQMALEDYRTRNAVTRDSAKQQNTMAALDSIAADAQEALREIQQQPWSPEQKAIESEKVQRWLEERQAALGIRQRLDSGV